MKKFFLLASLILMLSCSSDNDSQPAVTVDDRAWIATWKLVSIQDASGNEIATDCELQNGGIIVNYNPQHPVFDMEIAAIMKGVEDNGCHAVVRNNVNWTLSSMGLTMWYGDTFEIYDYYTFFENDHHYMELALKSDENSVEVPTEERKTCKYRRESIVYPN